MNLLSEIWNEWATPESIQKAGKKVHLKHLSSDCVKLLKHAEQTIEVNIIEDPNYKVVYDVV